MKTFALAALLLATGSAMAQPAPPAKEYHSPEWFEAHPDEAGAASAGCRYSHTVDDRDCISVQLARMNISLDKMTAMLNELKTKR